MEAPAIASDTADIWVYVYSEGAPSPEIGEFWWRFLKRGDAWEYHSALSQRIIMLQPPSLSDQVASRMATEPSPLRIALETVLRSRAPGDPSWVVVFDTLSLRASSSRHEISPDDLLGGLEGLAVLGTGCTEAEPRPCVTAGIESVNAVEGGYLLGMGWAGTGRACGTYSAHFHVSVAAGRGEVLSVTDEIEGICGPPQVK